MTNSPDTSERAFLAALRSEPALLEEARAGADRAAGRLEALAERTEFRELADELNEASTAQRQLSARLRSDVEVARGASDFDERCWRRLWAELEAPTRERLFVALDEIMATQPDARLVEEALWARDLCRGFDADELASDDLLMMEDTPGHEPGWVQLLRSVRSRPELCGAVSDAAEAALKLQLRIREEASERLPAEEVGRFTARVDETVLALRAIVAYLELGERVRLAGGVAHQALRGVWQGLPAGERALVMSALFDDGALAARDEARAWTSQEEFLDDLGRHVHRLDAD